MIERKKLRTMFLLVGTLPSKASICKSPGNSCMNENNYSQCRRLEELGCQEILVSESCPFQFECAGNEHFHAGSASVVRRREETVKPVSQRQEGLLAVLVCTCIALTCYIVYLHRELAKLAMSRLLGLSSPLLSAQDKSEENIGTDEVEMTFSMPEVSKVVRV
eukprot:CAMPEP_0195289668 /NCGR_PEP_ID=MMETSP0707-20130614/5848_1 /TAXON_ID=33640 /ORGANISM="Asterionellopsis glacialis, Strain CCMP134" /LENGTH=162 /DNA_ID=CAMNT_0040349695 /DNA_START=297 /DNA_END=785 /DNA_ORIENTATION=+